MQIIILQLNVCKMLRTRKKSYSDYIEVRGKMDASYREVTEACVQLSTHHPQMMRRIGLGGCNPN